VVPAAFLRSPRTSTVLRDDSVKAERSNYYDLGFQQDITRAFSLGVDSYYKQATDLIEEGQFGAPIILTPFNYRNGQVYGAEFTATYTTHGFSAYGNLAFQRAIGKDIITSQFNFSADDLAYIADHDIHLDHEQQMTAAGGISYLWQATRFSADMLIGSGLRADLTLPGGSSIPNGTHLPYYRQIIVGASHAFDLPGFRGMTARIDAINAFDQIYQIRNGTGVGVGVSQYGPRRGYFVGLSKSF
jgi:outer membrane receptor for ferrienterochelin and colicins